MTFERRGAWIRTFTGRKFYLTDPRGEDICIEDIAHHLALTCRFAGATREHYSVAQHCVLVSMACPLDTALWGLLHDAAEAYTGDSTRPLKQVVKTIYLVECHILEVIARRFGLAYPWPTLVDDIDDRILDAEGLALVAGWEANPAVVPLEIPIEPWPSWEAEAKFLARFRDLATARGIV
jgi:hypothetical protein